MLNETIVKSTVATLAALKVVAETYDIDFDDLLHTFQMEFDAAIKKELTAD